MIHEEFATIISPPIVSYVRSYEADKDHVEWEEDHDI